MLMRPLACNRSRAHNGLSKFLQKIVTITCACGPLERHLSDRQAKRGMQRVSGCHVWSPEIKATTAPYVCPLVKFIGQAIVF